jgi:protoporphyrinogen oxidase
VKIYDVAIVGAGFTGLTAAYELTKKGYSVKVIEADSNPGGLAGTFEFSDGITLEKFYHHWFNNDLFVPRLVNDLGLEGEIVLLPTKTGMYFNGQIWRLSAPLDLLKFKALSLKDRIRLGMLVFQVRNVKDWREIEHLSIREWLEPICGKRVFEVIWAPLINSKFSEFAEKISAVWMWKKLDLRGGTRNKRGGEQLAYFRGGFGELSKALVTAIQEQGGSVEFDNPVEDVVTNGQRVSSLRTKNGDVCARQVILTPAFPIIANLLQEHSSQDWLHNLRRVNYLGNICLVLRLNRSLSETYWLNVNDPGFPFVGIIEHTNFDLPENYSGSHIAYLSKYLSTESELWKIGDDDYFQFATSSLKKMFPDFEDSWVTEFKVWRSSFAQPVTEIGYSKYVPGCETPFENAWISTMAHIYPEDRGTNYAIREGIKIAELVATELGETEIR